MNLKKLLAPQKNVKVIPYTRDWDKRAQIGSLLIMASFGFFGASYAFEMEILMLPMPVISLLGLCLLSPQWGALMWSLEIKNRQGIELIFFSCFVQSLIILSFVTLKHMGK